MLKMTTSNAKNSIQPVAVPIRIADGMCSGDLGTEVDEITGTTGALKYQSHLSCLMIFDQTYGDEINSDVELEMA